MALRSDVRALLQEQANRLALAAYAHGLTVGEAVLATELGRAFVARIYAQQASEAVKQAHEQRRTFLLEKAP